MGETHVVGISDCKVSGSARDSVITYALGSCVGLALYDPRAKAGGLMHIMLPDSSYKAATRDFNPFMYADSGFYALLDLLLALGVRKQNLVAKLAGGANMLRHSSVLDIGKRNIEAVQHLLQKEMITVLGESLGGTVGRSMQLHLQDGSVDIRLLGVGEEKL